MDCRRTTETNVFSQHDAKKGKQSYLEDGKNKKRWMTMIVYDDQHGWIYNEIANFGNLFASSNDWINFTYLHMYLVCRYIGLCIVNFHKT